MDQTKPGSEKRSANIRRNQEKKSFVPPLVNTAAKSGFDIRNQGEKLHQDHNRAR